MPIYRYKCKNPKCGVEIEKMLDIAIRNEIFSCVSCDGDMKRVLESPHIKQGGSGTDPDTWSDQFWDNAEEERVNKLKKKQEDKSEKTFYKDKVTTQKIENKMTNLDRQGAKGELATLEKSIKNK